MRIRRGLGIWIGLASVIGLVLAPASAQTDYQGAIEKWRQDRETRLKADDGWLTVVGLYWLKEGENRFGTDASDDIVLPPGSAPGLVGAFEHSKGKTTVRVE